ncbi:MAG: hypothetical protein N2450_04250 [bacterium]|nr:hypothetical protein [bacterium]
MIRSNIFLFIFLICSNISYSTTVKNKNSNDFFQSLLIPGWAQYEQGRKEKSYIFIVNEIVFIASAVGLHQYGTSLKKDYQTYANLYSGLRDLTPRSHSFYVDLGNWNTSDDYNQARARERAFDRMYLSPNDQWHWIDESKRIRFKKLRIQSDKFLESVKFAVGGVILNHIISAFDASIHPNLKRPTNATLLYDQENGFSKLKLQIRW